MKTILLATAISITLSGCIAAPVAIPLGLAAGVPADRGINVAMGGTPGHTITTDDAISRDSGSGYAKSRCQIYDMSPLFVYDAFFFGKESQEIFEERKAYHCERLRLYETGELEKIKEEKAKNI